MSIHDHHWNTLYLGVLCGTLVLYIVSCAPGSLWQDSGLIHIRAWQGDLEGYWGPALAHPLYYLVAMCTKWLPWGGFAYRVNLISGIAGALAVANVSLLVQRWTGNNIAAVIGALTLALSHTFWLHACMAETYCLWAALFTWELLLLLAFVRTKRTGYLYGLFLVNGLSVAVHMFAVLPLGCYSVYLCCLFLQRRMHGKQVIVCLGLWLLGALPYLYVIVVCMLRSGDVTATIKAVFFGTRWQDAVLNTSLSLRMIKENLWYIALNFPSPVIGLLLIGLGRMNRLVAGGAFRRIVMVLLGLFLIFAFRYTVTDRYAFFIPFYCLVCLVMGVGAAGLLRWMPHNRIVLAGLFVCALLPAGVYAWLPILAQQRHFGLGTRGDVPYRDDYRYFLRPWRTGYSGADRFAREALEAVETGAVICADLTTVGPLLYAQQVKGQRRDVRIVSPSLGTANPFTFDRQWLTEALGRIPVYVVSRRPPYCPAFVLEDYDLRQQGPLWRVIPQGSASDT